MRARDLPRSDQMKNANHPLKRHLLNNDLLNIDVLHAQPSNSTLEQLT